MKRQFILYAIFLLSAFLFTALLITVIGIVNWAADEQIISIRGAFHYGVNLVAPTPFFIIDVIIAVLGSHLLFTSVRARLVAPILGAFSLIVGIGMIEFIIRLEYLVADCSLLVTHFCDDVATFRLQMYPMFFAFWALNVALKLTAIVLPVYALCLWFIRVYRLL